MKFRDSGMPPESMWTTFFDPKFVLASLGVDRQVETLLDIGCGYGTFLLSAADMVSNKVIGLDIDEKMIEVCRDKIKGRHPANIELFVADVCKGDGNILLGKYMGKLDYITLFNLLHCEEPLELLNTARALLRKGGRLGVIHWIYNESTPRGPAMAIRPKPADIISWAEETSFALEWKVDLPPYHYGLVFSKK